MLRCMLKGVENQNSKHRNGETGTIKPRTSCTANTSSEQVSQLSACPFHCTSDTGGKKKESVNCVLVFFLAQGCGGCYVWAAPLRHSLPGPRWCWARSAHNSHRSLLAQLQVLRGGEHWALSHLGLKLVTR